VFNSTVTKNCQMDSWNIRKQSEKVNFIRIFLEFSLVLFSNGSNCF